MDTTPTGSPPDVPPGGGRRPRPEVARPVRVSRAGVGALPPTEGHQDLRGGRRAAAADRARRPVLPAAAAARPVLPAAARRWTDPAPGDPTGGADPRWS